MEIAADSKQAGAELDALTKEIGREEDELAALKPASDDFLRQAKLRGLKPEAQ